MPRLHQVSRAARRVHCDSDGSCAVCCRDTRINAGGSLDRERKGRLRIVALHHQRQLQLGTARGRHSQAHQTSGLPRHESDVVGFTMLGADNNKACDATHAVLIQHQAGLAVPKGAEHLIDLRKITHQEDKSGLA